MSEKNQGTLGLHGYQASPRFRLIDLKPNVDVSKNRGFYPQIIHFYGNFHYKLSLFGVSLFLGNTHVLMVVIFLRQKWRGEI